MKSHSPEETRPAAALREGRWIRPDDPVGFPPAGGALAPGDGDELERLLVGDTRRRLARLALVEREIEDRIRSRWREAEAQIEEREARCLRDLTALESEAEAEAREARVQAQREGRTEGFREGFEKGAAEGRRLGIEKGRLEGLRDGRAQGRREEETRVRREIEKALEALAVSARKLEEERRQLLIDAQGAVVGLAVEIARKILKREVRIEPRCVLGNVEKAVEQIFRGCDVILQLHPEDARIVEAELKENPRWSEDFQSVVVRSSSDVARGGCRLLSGAGVVDLTIESQLELIEDALLNMVTEIDPGDATASPEPQGGER
ncbi:MAG: hypothetical protein JXA90_08875 [Planctomycetes bacterium]|nr:hypothetical protein [Planctomycetota bacterium]